MWTDFFHQRGQQLSLSCSPWWPEVSIYSIPQTLLGSDPEVSSSGLHGCGPPGTQPPHNHHQESQSQSMSLKLSSPHMQGSWTDSRPPIKPRILFTLISATYKLFTNSTNNALRILHHMCNIWDAWLLWFWYWIVTVKRGWWRYWKSQDFETFQSIYARSLQVRNKALHNETGCER